MSNKIMSEKYRGTFLLGTVFCIVLQTSTAAITSTVCTAGDHTKCQEVDSNAECPTDSTSCACKNGYKVDPNDDTKCLLSITQVPCTPGDGADGDTKCVDLDKNSECPTDATHCTCKSGYKGTDTCTMNTTCTPNDNAEGDKKCQGVDTNAECPAGTTKCACKTGYKVDPNDDTKCLLSITDVDCVSGDETDGDTKCQGLDGNSECPTGAKKCACKTGYTGTDTCSDESSADSVKVTTIVIALSLLSFIVRRMM